MLIKNHWTALGLVLAIQPMQVFAVSWTLSVEPPNAGDACLYNSNQSVSSCTPTKKSIALAEDSYVQLSQRAKSGYRFSRATKDGEDITSEVLFGFMFGPVSHSHKIVFYFDEAIAADAGEDRALILSAAETATLTLNGTGSGKSFNWTQIAGPAVIINNPNTADPTLTFTETGEYLFSLSVAGTQNYATDTVKITVEGDPVMQRWSGVFTGNLLHNDATLTRFNGELRNGRVQIKSPAPTTSEQPLSVANNQAAADFKLMLYSFNPVGEACDASGTFTLSNASQINGSGSWSCAGSGQQGRWTSWNYIDASSCTNTTDLCARLLIPDVPVSGIVLETPLNGIVTKANLIVLDASNSFSLQGNTLSYSWRLLTAIPIPSDHWYLINDDGSVMPWLAVAQKSLSAAAPLAAADSSQIPPEPRIGFIPPEAGEYQFDVTVSNGSASQTVQTPVIDIAAIVPEQQDNNVAPVVTLKNVKSGKLNKPVTLGISALDKDKLPDNLRVRIRQNSGPVADVSGFKSKQKDVKKKGRTLTATAKAKPVEPGTYGYVVTVSDGKAASSKEMRFPVKGKK